MDKLHISKDKVTRLVCCVVKNFPIFFFLSEHHLQTMNLFHRIIWLVG